MLRKLRPRLSFANVTSVLALFVALGGTSAYAINEWNSSNIQNETLLSEDIKNGTLQAADYGVNSVSGARIQDNNVTTLDLADGAVFGNDIRDGSLEDQDVGQGAFVNFQATVGTVSAHQCKEIEISGIDAPSDHLLLTPNYNTASGSAVIYSMEWRFDATTAYLQACNPTDFAAGEGTVQMNLLVFDAH